MLPDYLGLKWSRVEGGQIQQDSGAIEALRRMVLLHSNEIHELESSKRQSSTDWSSAWIELMYCILASTNIRSESAGKALLLLTIRLNGSTQYAAIARKPSEYRLRISRELESAGYRFPNTKSESIVSAASYFIRLVRKSHSPRDIRLSEVRRQMVDQIPGIGPKTVALWFRNLGFDIPVVDIHIRRILICSSLLDHKHNDGNLSERDYYSIESLIKQIAGIVGVPSADLDCALWEHGKRYCRREACDSCPLG